VKRNYLKRERVFLSAFAKNRPFQRGKIGCDLKAIPDKMILLENIMQLLSTKEIAMESAQIWHEIRIKASPDAIFSALTEPQKLGRWWIPDTRGESSVGKSLAFWFSPTASQVMDVVELKPGDLVRWRAAAGPMSDWAGTEVEFKIVPRGELTGLQIRHHGWKEIADGFPYYSLSWAVYLTSLKDFLQSGVGSPFPNKWADG